MVSLGTGAFWRHTFASLGYRNFRLVWSASMVHHMGEWMEMAGLLWFVQHLTGSTLSTSIIFFLRIIPLVVLSVPAGLLADRMSRRNMMIWSKVGTSILSIILAVLVQTGWVAYWHLVVLSLLASLTTSLNMPARQSTLPNLVRREHLMNAISLDTASMMSSRLLGAPLAGLLLAHTGVTFIFGLRALGGIIAIILLARIPRFDPVRNEGHPSPLEDLLDGFKYLKKESVVFALVITSFLPMFANLSYMGLLPAFATEVLKVGAWEYGLLQMAPGVGSALSLLTLATLGRMQRRGLFLFTSAIIMGLALIGFASSPWLILSFPMLMVTGSMFNAYNTVNTTVIQGLIPDDMRGRVMGLRETVRGLAPLGSLLAGAIANVSGPPMGAGIVGGVVVAIPLTLLFLLPRVRRLD